MRLHPRMKIVDQAQHEIETEFWNKVKEHDLTYGEIMRILGQQIDKFGQYMVRDERHPNDPDSKGNEA